MDWLLEKVFEIIENPDKAESTIRKMIKFGNAAEKLLIEEFLDG